MFFFFKIQNQLWCSEEKKNAFWRSELCGFYVLAQCLLTAERGFVHAWIISGVSVPLGLWKPSLPTINRSAGRMLRLAGGKRSAPQSQDATGSRPIHAVPDKHMCLLTNRQFHQPST